MQTNFSKSQAFVCATPQDTFDLGEALGETLRGGEMILLAGNLGSGKTLFTKGILYALDFDVDEVTSPSFTLVNLYRTERFDVYHIDLWRIEERSDPAGAVGLAEILEDATAVKIIEWSERLADLAFTANTFNVTIEGDGDDARQVNISRNEMKMSEGCSAVTAGFLLNSEMAGE